MKISYLKINSKFKNLNDIKIDFNIENFMTVIVGRNGAGKSNVIEALVSIFRNLDLGEKTLFSFEILYHLENNGNEIYVRINADNTEETVHKQYKIDYSQDLQIWNKISISKVKRDSDGKSDYLPRHVFAYYSGSSDRLESYFVNHRVSFYRKLLENKLDMTGEMRPMFYAKPIHSQFVLLAFFLNNGDMEGREFLKKYLGIENLESVHFTFRKPEWAKKSDELFWGARGVVKTFIDKIISYSSAPIKSEGMEPSGYLGTAQKNEFVHLHVNSLNDLQNIANGLSSDEFFKMLESTLLSNLLFEIKIRVKVKNVNEILSFSELSEGEQQLLTLLGLLKFTGGKDTLFLLDEPDTHLNPSWTVDYFKFLEEFTCNKESTQIVLATHHPLAIAELKKEQIRIMWKDEHQNVYSSIPENDPLGMGYAGLLTSDLFGLKSDLDSKTLKLLNEHAALLSIENRTLSENERYEELKLKLNNYGFLEAYSDPYFKSFVQSLTRKISNTPIYTKTLSSEELEELSDMTDQILEELDAEEESE